MLMGVNGMNNGINYDPMNPMGTHSWRKDAKAAKGRLSDPWRSWRPWRFKTTYTPTGSGSTAPRRFVCEG